MAMTEIPSSPPAVQSRPPAPPSVLSGALRIFDLSLGQMLWSRRTLFMALVVGVPVLIAFALRTLEELGMPIMRSGRATVGGGAVFGLMVWGFYVRFAAPVLEVFYGTALIADEVEDKTLTYLFTRPIPLSLIHIS